MIKTQKQYYLHNMRSPYVPINRTLHRERETERAREKETEREIEKERDMEWLKHINGTL